MNKKQYSESEDSLLNDPIASATECTGLIPSGSSFEEEAEAYQEIFPVSLAEEPILPKNQKPSAVKKKNNRIQ